MQPGAMPVILFGNYGHTGQIHTHFVDCVDVADTMDPVDACIRYGQSHILPVDQNVIKQEPHFFISLLLVPFLGTSNLP